MKRRYSGAEDLAKTSCLLELGVEWVLFCVVARVLGAETDGAGLHRAIQKEKCSRLQLLFRAHI